MMWFCLFVLAAGGLVEAIDDCSRPTEEVCDLAGFIRMVSEREIFPNCKMVKESLECIIQVEEKCHFDDNFLTFAKNAFEDLKPRCDYTELPTAGAEAVDDNVDCSVTTENACKLDTFNFGLGSNKHDRCRALLETTECMIRVEEKCHFNDNVLEMAKETLPALKRICGKDRAETSRLQGTKSRLECIRNVLNVEKMGTCTAPPCKFKLVKYAEALLNKGLITDVDVNTLVCIGGLNVFSCIAVSVERKCGKVAFNEYMETFESMPGDTIIGCSGTQIKDFFPTMLQVYKESERAETLLKNVFKSAGF